jgi:hypothetical protein
MPSRPSNRPSVHITSSSPSTVVVSEAPVREHETTTVTWAPITTTTIKTKTRLSGIGKTQLTSSTSTPNANIDKQVLMTQPIPSSLPNNRRSKHQMSSKRNRLNLFQELQKVSETLRGKSSSNTTLNSSASMNVNIGSVEATTPTSTTAETPSISAKKLKMSGKATKPGMHTYSVNHDCIIHMQNKH